MTNAVERERSPVTVTTRTIVYVSVLGLLAIGIALVDTDTGASRFGVWDVAGVIGSELLIVIGSGLSLPLRAAIGLFGAAPMSFLADIVQSRPEAFSPTNIGSNIIGAGAMAIILPWLDPPQRFWTWARGAGQHRVRLGMIYAAWALWLLAASIACSFVGYEIGALFAGQHPFSDFEALGVGIGVAAIAAGIWLVVLTLKQGTGAYRMQLLRSAIFAGIGVAVLQLILMVVLIATARGIISVNGPAASTVAEMIRDWETGPWSAFGFAVVSALIVWLAALPVVYGLVARDAHVMAKGRRSKLTSAAILVSTIVPGMSAGSLLAVVTGSLLFGTGGHGEGRMIGVVVGAVAGLAGAIWLIRRRPLVRPAVSWPEPAVTSVSMPAAVADAVRDSAARQA